MFVLKFGYDAATRILTSLSQSADTVTGGTNGDNNSLELQFTITDTEGVLDGAALSCAFDVIISTSKGNKVYHPELTLKDITDSTAKKVVVPGYIMDAVMYEILPIQLHVRSGEADDYSDYFSLNKLELNIKYAIDVHTGVPYKPPVKDLMKAFVDVSLDVEELEMNFVTAAGVIKSIDVAQIGRREKQYTLDSAEELASDECKDAASGDTALITDKQQWWVLYRVNTIEGFAPAADEWHDIGAVFNLDDRFNAKQDKLIVVSPGLEMGSDERTLFLTKATTENLGGMIVGDRLVVDNGRVSATVQYTYDGPYEDISKLLAEHPTGQSNTIYLVKNEIPSTTEQVQGIYDEYIWVKNPTSTGYQYEKLGGSDSDKKVLQQTPTVDESKIERPLLMAYSPLEDLEDKTEITYYTVGSGNNISAIPSSGTLKATIFNGTTVKAAGASVAGELTAGTVKAANADIGTTSEEGVFTGGTVKAGTFDGTTFTGTAEYAKDANHASKADEAATVGNKTVGSATKPIYIKDGVPTMCTPAEAGEYKITWENNYDNPLVLGTVGGVEIKLGLPTDSDVRTKQEKITEKIGVRGVLLSKDNASAGSAEGSVYYTESVTVDDESGIITAEGVSSKTIDSNIMELKWREEGTRTIAPKISLYEYDETSEKAVIGGKIEVGNISTAGDISAGDSLTVAGSLTVNGDATFIGTLTGTATAAEKLTTSSGTVYKPIYFADGKPKVCTVPASVYSKSSEGVITVNPGLTTNEALDAVLTELKSKTGTTNLEGTKMYVVCAKNQNAAETTYSNKNFYMDENGDLYIGGKSVVTGLNFTELEL